MITPEKLLELYDIYIKHPVVVTDSRRVSPNSLFFALRGVSFDGNQFAKDTLVRGAVLAVVDDVTVIPLTDGRVAMHGEAVAMGYFLVENVLETLQKLAMMHRASLGIPILAITGTNGKTTTKELTAAVLSQKYKLYATQGNLNNHIGVPLTLLAMKSDVEFGIVEMGASAQQEIALLCEITKPNFGIITNVGRAHLEGFGGEEGVKKAKGELYDYLQSNAGCVFVREEDDRLMAMAQRRDGLCVVNYSEKLADDYHSNLAGDYNQLNIAAAVAIGEFFDVDSEAVRAAISGYVPNANRSQVIDTGDNMIIADCYNANPSSMKVALEWFASSHTNDGYDAKVVVLGDMFELGAWSQQEHSDVLKTALTIAPKKIILLGKEFANAFAKLPEVDLRDVGVVCYDGVDEFADALRGGLEVIVKSTLLLKGSRGMALERMIELL